MDQLSYTENIQPILNLFMSLAEHFGIISAVAFILLSTRTLQRMISRELTVQDKLALILFFGAFGIFGTYDGDPIQGVVANLRAISMILAGLIGGPVVGIGAGGIAGCHRFLMDINGFSSLPCALGTFLEGAAAGLVSMRLRNRALNWRVALILGVIGESVHMGLVLAISQPFETALAVVRLIGIPMIILNSIGAACLIEMIRMVVRNRERRASIQARKAMTIANRTVIHLREGLNEASAMATARIIHEQTRVTAVAITDTQQLLAYVGIGEELYRPGQNLLTSTTHRVLMTGKPVFAHGKTAVGEEVPHQMLQSAIVAPLIKSGKIIGTLKLYGDKKHSLNPIDFEIANGLANLFSTQLELQDIQIKSQLLDRAEIKRLQAQINPHFLFNSLNTIASFCRTNSNRARQLLMELSNYLRRNIKDRRQYITLDDELKQIESYLTIEHARFGDRIQFEMDIVPETKEWPLPPLIVQPLVENAVKHGLSGKKEGGKVCVQAAHVNGVLQIQVKDNGIGMSSDAIAHVYKNSGADPSNSSMGLRNVNQRLEHIYGPSSSIQIDSADQQGTTITLTLPMAKDLTN
jgi:two-component system sensor histidine kinase LytS